jgi:hypothetical protein
MAVAKNTITPHTERELEMERKSLDTRLEMTANE